MSPLAVSGLPLYRRIEADLRDRIRSGALRPGGQVAPEPELMAEYGVSRATVRQALAGLLALGRLAAAGALLGRRARPPIQGMVETLAEPPKTQERS